MRDYREILVDIQEKIATVTFNRPEQQNTFTTQLKEEVADAFENLGQSKEVRVIVLTGAGKNFCAGGDIKMFKTRIESGDFLTEDGFLLAAKMANTIRRCPKPVIAMVNGAAAGAGCSLAAACDFRFAQPGSKFGMAFINMAFSGDTVGIYNLQRIIGVTRTEEMIMTGDLISAEKAAEWGLTKLTSENALKEETYQFAKKLAQKSPKAIAYQKRLIAEFFYSDLDAYTRKEAEVMACCARSKDHAEAVYAFLEKRKANFIGE